MLQKNILQKIEVVPDSANDRVFVMREVKQSWAALEFASKELRDDYEIIIEALKQNESAIHLTSHAGNLDVLLPLAHSGATPGTTTWEEAIALCEEEIRTPTGIHFRGI